MLAHVVVTYPGGGGGGGGGGSSGGCCGRMPATMYAHVVKTFHEDSGDHKVGQQPRASAT